MTDPPPAGSGAADPQSGVVDSRAAEIVARSIVRALFRNGVHVPIRLDGLVDMDVVVRDSDVLVNLHQFQAELPQLAIWRITLAYRGKPVVEYGRGIKRDTKVHLGQACVLLLSLWKERLKRAAYRHRREAARELELVTPSAYLPKP